MATLFKSLLKNRLFWEQNLLNIENTTMSAKSRLHPPYSIAGCSIGEGTYIAHNSKISQTIIGKFSSIGPNFLCGFGIHPTNGISTSPVFYSTRNQAGFSYSKSNKIEERKTINIGSDVFIGMNVTVLDGVTIGDGAVIGAGAVVSKDIPPYAIAIGCPIQIVKYRFEQDTIEKLLKLSWWNQDEKVREAVEKHLFDLPGFFKEIENV
ncbi:CatB-related O-acetyltransferase [Dyadobacter sp.]|uniref:CatB-related O-acetyltransferase n=1 Tax=Dyadobacter sp. TaxID=1914288 RepID=UPI00326353BF